MREIKVYLANGLFTAGDRMFNDLICDKLEAAGVEYYAPQKNLAINDKSASATSIPIYNGDTEKLKWCNILIAVLDGVSIDAGVAGEVGWVAGWNEAIKQHTATGEDKIILGLYTDNRDFSRTANEKKNSESQICGLGESQYSYVNLYTVGCVKKYGKLFSNVDDLIKYIEYLKNLNDFVTC